MDRLLWTQIQDFGPSLRLGAGISYDSDRDRIVLFGGGAGNALLSDTWEFDGTNWEQVADFGPPGRVLGGMSYDTNRKKTVLFGGDFTGGPGDPNATWEWDGQYWVQVFDGGAPNQKRLICYDAINNYSLMVTTPDAAGVSATWSWDGNQWTQLNEAPLGTNGQLAFDPVGKQVLYCASPAPSPVTYAWTGKAWKQLSDIGPQFVDQQSYVYSDGSEAIGYFTNTLQTWSWSGKGWLQRQNMGPAARTDASVAGDTKRKRLVLFGGSLTQGGATVGDTWVLQRSA
jgi:hypothetical protein